MSWVFIGSLVLPQVLDFPGLLGEMILFLMRLCELWLLRPWLRY